MNNIRTLALAAVMAMAAMPGMAGEAARKVCVVNGDLNGWPANLVTIARLGEDARYYADTIPIGDGHIRYELDADGSTAYCITAWRGGSGRYANFIAENGEVSITFHPDGVADVRSDTPLNKEMLRVVAATDTITAAAFGRLEALERARLDYTEPARRLMELRQTTRNSDSLKAIDTELRRLQADGRLLTPEFVAANNAVGEAFRRMYKVRCTYAVEHPGLVGLSDETLACGPKEHTRWWQRYRGHLQGLLYRLILNIYLMPSLPILRWLARPWRRFMPSAILRLTPHGGFRVGSRGATPRLEATISTSRPPIWRATTTHCRKR